MVMIKLKPNIARWLIAKRESERRPEAYESLEKAISRGRWDEVPAIWITPNFLFNGLFCNFPSEWHPTLKPLIVYNGHHRLEKAIERNLPVTAYVRYTPGNPNMPEKEKLQYDLDC
jgi:hypothetical protein